MTDADIHFDPDFKLQKSDVFGTFDPETRTQTSKGMVVAQGHPDHPVACPVFGDIVPWKSVTVICKLEEEGEVTHWLSYVHGGDTVSNRQEFTDGRVALRSDYQCW
jgi:hypothetical protein